jgi:hypothetical protein
MRILSELEQIGFNNRNHAYRSDNPTLHSSIPSTGKYIKDSYLGWVLIFRDQNNNILYIKTDLDENPSQGESTETWFDTFWGTFKNELAQRSVSLVKTTGISLSVLVVIGVVIFMVIYAPKR